LIELRRPDGAGPLPEALARRVLPRRPGQETATLLVPQRNRDRLLLAALEAGWSVVFVSRAVTDSNGSSNGGPGSGSAGPPAGGA